MHMADALISPVVGGVMIAAATGLAAYSIRKVQKSLDQSKVPLMGVLGAFVFAAQMINFTIPGTGSSGHIGGGLLLAALLGPAAGFLTIAAVLLIQALFFADGGLLAYGCNLFNLGFYACFLIYPLIFRRIAGKELTGRRIWLAAVISAILGLQLGAFSVVLETMASGKTELPFIPFVLLMQPIHLAIGLVEGLVTASILVFVRQARPELLLAAARNEAIGAVSIKKVLAGLAVGVLIIGGLLSWFASANPDGLEWALGNVAGAAEPAAADPVHQSFADIQAQTAFLPDYDFPASAEEPAANEDAAWPAVNAGTSLSGLVGGALTLLLTGLIGFLIILFKRRRSKSAA